MPHKMSTNFLYRKGSCEQDVSMSPDVNTSSAHTTSMKSGPRRRDVVGTRASGHERGPPRTRPPEGRGPTRLRRAPARAHTHSQKRALRAGKGVGRTAGLPARRTPRNRPGKGSSRNAARGPGQSSYLRGG